MQRLLFPLAFTLLTLCAAAQDTWSLVNATPPNGFSALAYDSARDRVVAVGNSIDNARHGAELDTWEFDGTNWEQRRVVGPIHRSETAIAYDEARGVVVLFGGFNGVNGFRLLGDTWEWDGDSWSLAATSGPSPRRGGSLVYDPSRGRVLLHGGRDASVGPANLFMRADTWEWDGSSWNLLADGGPNAAFAGLTYDSARDRVVLHGGEAGILQFPVPGTWEWDGASWTERSSSGPVTIDCKLEYVPGLAKCVLLSEGSPGPTECWTWDGAAWTQHAGLASRFAVFRPRAQAAAAM